MNKQFFLAPMEGITGYVYRNALNKYYGGVDYYITPFISPTHSKILNHKEEQDILPKNNEGINLIPQILANDAQLFIATAERLKSYGYNEVNLNLGCPSGTVVSKAKGSGFLADIDALDDFLLKIFEEVNGRLGMDISIKTRIGRDDISEFKSLLIIFNQYPIKLLTIHPRIQKEFYKGNCHMDIFEEAVLNSSNPICYNGDIISSNSMNNIPDVDYYMIGRGALKNPAVFLEISGKEFITDEAASRKRLKNFHDEIYAGYEEIFSGDRNVLFKMKELWSYLGAYFGEPAKELKKIRKAQKKDGYYAAVDEIFRL